MTVGDLRQQARGIDERDVNHILAHVLQCDQAWLLAHADEAVSDTHVAAAQALFTRRAKHEPLAYLLGFQPFYERDFAVTNDVLIPRLESELMIDAVKKDLTAIAKPVIIDVGTGSGCLAITAALEIPAASVTAIDISATALAIARKNAERWRASSVSFTEGSLLQPALDKQVRAHAILANLPYLPQEEIDRSPTANELAFEPQQALLTDDQGLALIKMCTNQAARVLKDNGKLYLEMLPDQIPLFLTWLMISGLPFTGAILQDLTGQNRIVVLTKLVEG